MRYEVEAGEEELDVVLGAGVDEAALAVVSLELEDVFVSDDAALLPDSEAAPDPEADPDSEPDSPAGALLLAA
jgi:hypothetical protein